MKIEIRDITPEEAEPYSVHADVVLAERKTVVFTDEEGNVGKLYMKEEDIELLGESYIAENSTMEYSDVCGEWFPKVSWNAYKNDPKRNPPKTVDVEFVCDMEGECTEIWRRLDTGGYLITPEAVRREAAEILEERMQDYRFLLRNNIEEIMAEAKKGRAQYE